MNDDENTPARTPGKMLTFPPPVGPNSGVWFRCAGSGRKGEAAVLASCYRESRMYTVLQLFQVIHTWIVGLVVDTSE